MSKLLRVSEARKARKYSRKESAGKDAAAASSISTAKERRNGTAPSWGSQYSVQTPLLYFLVHVGVLPPGVLLAT